ncbi:Dynamitin-domain-containing protein [Suillus fuscotomentosus]|uniref:Dynamitin-domain-containing protein n=1 Tax=Suillus fuscotomentosus TaxID=1912939 RepID=A0AAD4HPZ5_9AGAM|nr:Dynamitin-domain-containing protein [Suillus fuscotomentosus]KAG1904301.1 Dynamitin-domain-containing protein [Suillus fuscotomentosus]
MSANKYANLPDIDTAQDVYETEDVFPSSEINKGDSDSDEPSGPRIRAQREELDDSNLISAEDASRHFRRAERRRQESRFAYPPSPTSSPSRSPSPSRRPLPTRLRALQAELAALEGEVADPSNPALKAEGVDAGEMIRGLVDVRRRLEKVRMGREGRGRLVGVVLGDGTREDSKEDVEESSADDKTKESKVQEVPEVRGIAEMDKRVGELEKLVGSVGATLDESTPITPPLLPMLTRLNSQLMLLTQPRHIDSISRRLKLLLSDLERVSTAQTPKRQSQQPGGSTVIPGTATQDALLPLLTRLAPSLPHVPHILTRLRTLSALHASAGEFQGTMAALEEEQRKTKDALEALKSAVGDVETSLEANKGTVAGNVQGLEDRVDRVLTRLEELSSK